MSPEKIIELARQADWPDSLIAPVIMEKLNDFAKLVAQHEREACAKLIETEIGMNPTWQKHLAQAIRARGQA